MHGFRNKFRKEYETLDLGKLQLMIDQGRINAKKPIDMKTLHDSGAVSKKITHGVKLLAKVCQLTIFYLNRATIVSMVLLLIFYLEDSFITL